MTDSKNQTNNNSSNAMPLFYSKPEPLDPKRHAGLGLNKEADYSFAAKINALPINMVEIATACHTYPVAFSPDGMGTPVAITGLRDDENLFIDEKGRWIGGVYIPAYARRYPFIFSRIPASENEEERLSLCVDAVDGVVVKSEGDDGAFFDADGKPSELTNNALEFCKSYQSAAVQTEKFGAALEESGLLIERQVNVDVPGKHRVSFSGFKIIDEEKLKNLDDGMFLDWRAKGWLPFIYAHLISGSQWDNLGHLLAERLQPRERK